MLKYVLGPSVDIFLDFRSKGVEEWMNDIAIQICDAIGKLHDGQLVHGDLLIHSDTNQLVGCSNFNIVLEFFWSIKVLTLI